MISLFWFAEILFVRRLNCYDNVVLTFFLYPLVGYIFILLLLYPKAQYVEIGEYSNVTSRYMYYFHPLLFLLVPGIKEMRNALLWKL